MSVEQRTVNRKVELRSDGEGPPRISGYAATFYREGDRSTEYELWRGAYERVMPGAFDETLKRDDIRGLFNHDAASVLGRVKSGTMTLTVDDIGLRYEFEPADTTLYRDVAEMIRRGDVDGSSFGFSIVGEDVWYRDAANNEIRELRNVKLYDVGPVTYPAYAASTSEARSARDAWAGESVKIDRERIEREHKLRLTQLTIFRTNTRIG